jgi:hypothetical protein
MLEPRAQQHQLIEKFLANGAHKAFGLTGFIHEYSQEAVQRTSLSQMKFSRHTQSVALIGLFCLVFLAAHA